MRRTESPRPPPPRWGWRIVGLLVLLLVLGVIGWIGYAQWARAEREVRDVGELSRGQGRWISVGDARIYLREWGREDRPILMLVHGTGAWSGTWFGLPDALVAAGWRVVAVDLPPFGLSEATASDRTLDYRREAQARRLLAVIATLGRPVTLLGHSYGAGPALEAAMRGGDAIRQLVMVDPALGLGPEGEAPTCEAGGMLANLLSIRPVRTALVASTATWPGFTRTLLKSFVYRKDRIDERLVPAYQVPFARRAFSADLGDWAVAFSRVGCEGAESQDPVKLRRWSTIHTPVRLIWGSEDDVTPMAQSRALRGWLYGSTLASLVDVGHIPHVEDPQRFASLLIRELPPPR